MAKEKGQCIGLHMEVKATILDTKSDSSRTEDFRVLLRDGDDLLEVIQKILAEGHTVTHVFEGRGQSISMKGPSDCFLTRVIHFQWVCCICKERRLDSNISVLQKDLSTDWGLPPGTALFNLKYCNDKTECVKGAHAFKPFDKEHA